MNRFFDHDHDRLPRRASPVWLTDAVTLPPDALITNIGELCMRARMPLRAEIDRDVVVFCGRGRFITPTVDLVGIPEPPGSRRGALRALQELAFHFDEYLPLRAIVPARERSVETRRRSPRRWARKHDSHGMFAPGDQLFLVSIGQLARARIDVGTWFDGVTFYTWSEIGGSCYRHESFLDGRHRADHFIARCSGRASRITSTRE